MTSLSSCARASLKPLGHPPASAVKYFSRQRVQELCSKDSWIVQVSDTLVRHWQVKNERRTGPKASLLPMPNRRTCAGDRSHRNQQGPTLPARPAEDRLDGALEEGP